MRSLRAKILCLAALLVLLTQAGTIGTLLFAASGEIQERARTELATAGTIIDRVLTLRAQQMQNTLRLLAIDPEFTTALRDQDQATLSSALRRSASSTGTDVAALLDRDGRTLTGGAVAPATVPTDLPYVVMHADEGIIRSTAAVNSQLYEFVTVALDEDHGDARWLALGIALDDNRARRIAQLTGFDIAFMREGDTEDTAELLGHSLGDAAPGVPFQVTRNAGAADVTRIAIGDTEYLAVAEELVPNASYVKVLLLRSVDDVLAPYRTLRLASIVLGFVALIVALSGAAVAARAITHPLRELVRAAIRIRNGDYSRPVAAEADDELGMLATAFNTMQNGIAERESHITHQAQYDKLTGLPNRLLALERIATALITDGTSAPLSLLIVDLGSFGHVASTLGHEIGDALLTQAAERLRASVDARHMVAHLEGDEFLIVLAGVDVDAACVVAEDLLQLLGVGLSVRDVNISLDAAMGVATYPKHGREPDQLLLRATVAKSDARSVQQRLHVYQEGREERHVRQLAILGDLRRAVRHDELKLYLQPKIALGDRRVCGAEALVRWDHPTFGWLAPGEFIGIAERFGNISLITHWALAAAVRECRLWVEDGLDISVSVNLSSRDLLDQNLPVFIRELLRDHDLAPRYLTLEVTEEALVRDFDRATIVLQCLRDLGVRISIDDFGTGYSSLGQIKNLPVDELKIDRSFVMGLPQAHQDAAIVQAAINLAHSLGLEVVAEGVETPGALHWLTANGCERAQGFLFSRPMPTEAFVGWVERYVSTEQAPYQTSAIVVPNSAVASAKVTSIR